MSEKQPRPITEWRNINKDLVEDPEIAHELALQQNQFHDASILYGQVVEKAIELDEPFAASSWDLKERYNMQMDGPIVVDALEKVLHAKKKEQTAKDHLDSAVEAHDKSLVAAMELRPRLEKPELDYGTGQNEEVDAIRVRRRKTLNNENAAIDAHALTVADRQEAEERWNDDYIQSKLASRDEGVKIATENIELNPEDKAA